jgi:hypothetical protein
MKQQEIEQIEAHPWFCKCGKRKQTTNHWTVARRRGVVLEFIPWAAAVRRRLLGASGVVLLCGQDCGHRELNEFYDALLAKRVFPVVAATKIVVEVVDGLSE